MKISIIIPVYNVEKYIVDCLSSIYEVENQSDFEIIIVDDCSPDNSVSLVRNFIKEVNVDNIKIVKHEINKGLGAARNTGVLHAKNPYVWFLDSDDAIDPVQFTQLIESTSEDFDVLLMGVAECDANLNFKKEYLKYDEFVVDDYSLQYKNKKLKQLDVVAWNKIIKRDLFILNSSLTFGEGVLNEDEVFSLLLCKYAKKVIFKEELVYLYRIRENSITTSTISNQFFDSWEVNFKQALLFFHDYKLEFWQDWFLEKIQIFNRKYSFSPEQLVILKKLLTPYYSMYPERLWNNNWRFRENTTFFEDWFNIYELKIEETPLVSVIIPTYKRPENLIRALQSVLNQSYKNIEVIIINDTGNVDDYQSKYHDLLLPFLNKVTYVQLTQNMGGGAARNIGINEANGKYISFLDDDDSYCVDRIKNAVNEIQKYSVDEVWGVYCGYKNNESGSVNNEFYSGDLTYDILNLNYAEFSLNTDTVLIKKEFLMSYDIRFNPKLRRHQDLDLFLKLFRHGYVIGYKNIDVIIRPEKTEIGNWLNDEVMHSTKRYFLHQHKDVVETFLNQIQEEIYNIQWNNVLHYYLGNEKIERFKNFVVKSKFNEVDSHEYFFLVHLINKLEIAEPEESKELIQKQDKAKREMKLDNETLNSKVQDLALLNKELNLKVEDLLSQKNWYENTYEKMPMWWKKMGALVRKIKN